MDKLSQVSFAQSFFKAKNKSSNFFLPIPWIIHGFCRFPQTIKTPQVQNYAMCQCFRLMKHPLKKKKGSLEHSIKAESLPLLRFDPKTHWRFFCKHPNVGFHLAKAFFQKNNTKNRCSWPLLGRWWLLPMSEYPPVTTQWDPSWTQEATEWLVNIPPPNVPHSEIRVE